MARCSGVLQCARALPRGGRSIAHGVLVLGGVARCILAHVYLSQRGHTQVSRELCGDATSHSPAPAMGNAASRCASARAVEVPTRLHAALPVGVHHKLLDGPWMQPVDAARRRCGV